MFCAINRDVILYLVMCARRTFNWIQKLLNWSAKLSEYQEKYKMPVTSGIFPASGARELLPQMGFLCGLYNPQGEHRRFNRRRRRLYWWVIRFAVTGHVMEGCNYLCQCSRSLTVSKIGGQLSLPALEDSRLFTLEEVGRFQMRTARQA